MGIPLTCLLIFHGSMGIKGIWVGPTLSVIFITLAYQMIVYLTDWQKLFEEQKEEREAAKKVEGSDDDYKKVDEDGGNVDD